MLSLRKLKWAALAVVMWPVPRAAAAEPTEPGSESPPAPPAETADPPGEPADAPPSPPAPLPEPPPPAPAATPPAAAAGTPIPARTRRGRAKPLQLSAGRLPTAQDVGSEADIMGVTAPEEQAVILDQWSYTLKGSIRVPLAVSFGRPNHGGDGIEPHSPPRIVGRNSGNWEYISLAPNASASLKLTVGNRRFSANLFYGTSHLLDPGYPAVDLLGIQHAYLAIRFPDAFGDRGGIAVVAGAFGERFGLSGPYGKSSGYYSTYVHGRTRLAGESITASYDLTDHWELLVEHGVGAKVEVVPFILTCTDDQECDPPIHPGDPSDYVVVSDDLDAADGSGPQPYGSTFVHHAHLGLDYDTLIQLRAHYLTSWTPNDNALSPDAPEGRLTSIGGEAHYDREEFSAYLGYSHIEGDELYALHNGLSMLHSGTGRSFKLNYFGEKGRLGITTPTRPGLGDTPRNDSGTVDTVVWQFQAALATLFDDPFGGRDLNVAVYGMFNHVRSDKTDASHPLDLNIRDNKLKFGLDSEFTLLRFMAAGMRIDRVIPRLDDQRDAYSAVTPRLRFYTSQRSKEQVILSYTRFFNGPLSYPASPYTDGYFTPDTDLIVLMGRMSF